MIATTSKMYTFLERDQVDPIFQVLVGSIADPGVKTSFLNARLIRLTSNRVDSQPTRHVH